MSLDEIIKCWHKECAETQRATEIMTGLGLEGTRGYELIGCYECNGFNTNCKKYEDLSDYDI